MRLTVIGCRGGSPKKNEACSGYLLEAEEMRLLLDCGSGVLGVLQNVAEVTEINHIILSHYHYDHFSDAGSAVYARLVNMQLGNTTEKLHLYAPKDDLFFNTLEMPPYSEVQEINESRVCEIGPFQIRFLKTKHPIECYAMKVAVGGKILVYTADTAYLEGLVEFAQNADILIAECSLYSGISGEKAGHMNSLEVARLARDAGVKQLIYTHLPIYGNCDELKQDILQIYDGAVTKAEKLLEMDII